MQIYDKIFTVMYENQNQLIINNPKLSRKLLMTILGCGIVLTTTHGAFFGNHQYTAPGDFKETVARDLHVHDDARASLHSRVMVDPKSLRSVRSEGDKEAEGDRARGGWDVYQA